MIDAKTHTELANAGGTKSAILHPYFDLNDSLAVAKVVHDKGGGSCARDLVAASLKYSTTKSGAFQSRLSAAKQFGFIRVEGDAVVSTDLAMTALHPVTEQNAIVARRDAFLNVPLFQKVYEKFKGGSLPQELGFQNLFKSEYKLSDDRLKPAVRVMLDSAEQAGFFAAAGNKSRMIAPSGVLHTANGKFDAVPARVDLEAKVERPAASIQRSVPDTATDVHPALLAMLRELPRSGAEWPPARKDRFMAAFRSIVDVVYPDPEVTP